MFSTWPKCRCNAEVEPAPALVSLGLGAGGGGEEGALTQSQQGSSGQAPACSVMLYCVASAQRSQRLDTVGSKLDKINLVLVLLIIAFATPDLKGYIQPSSQNMYIFHL